MVEAGSGVRIICYNIERRIICYTIERRIICYTIERRIICYTIERRIICYTIERRIICYTIERRIICYTIERRIICYTIERRIICYTIERRIICYTIERRIICYTIERRIICYTIERRIICYTIERRIICYTIERRIICYTKVGSKDPTSTLPSKLDRILKRLLTDNKITKSFYDSCRNLHPRSPQLYGIPKIHKVNCPIRPIVSFYNTPLTALHKTLAHYLKPLSNSNLRLKDSNDMIQILRSITGTSSHSYFCSLDIKSLYTTCNMKHAQRIVKSKLQDHPSLLPSNISSTAFDTLISFCLDNSYFEYNNKFFAQNTGGPMGSPLTVELAEIRVTELETIALNTSPQPPSLYKHFVDDGFGVFRDKTHAETYLKYVNSLSSDLVYTIEHPSQDGSIPFLDIRKDLSTSVYRKPTHTDTYTQYSTAAPQTTKDSLIRSLTRRAYNICSPST